MACTFSKAVRGYWPTVLSWWNFHISLSRYTDWTDSDPGILWQLKPRLARVMLLAVPSV